MSEQNKIPETSITSDNKLLIEIAVKKRLAHLIQKLHQGSLSQNEIKELRQLGGTPLPAGCVWTQKEIAEAFNVALRTVQRWAERGMPKEPEEYYHLVKISYWKMADEIDKTSEENWGEINKKYLALIHELEYKSLKKKLVSREEVEAGQIARVVAVTQSFGALPREVAPAMEGMSVKEREAFLTERINDIRNQFAEPILKDEEDEEDEEIKSGNDITSLEEDEEDNGEGQEEKQNNLAPGRKGIVESPAENNSLPVE